MRAAREYAWVCRWEGSNHARARQIEDTINALVGRWVGGKLVIPAAVRAAMIERWTR